MTALRRTRLKLLAAAFAASTVLPAMAVAQDSQPVDVTAAPPPGNDSVGPSQLRDFSLGGQVTRPAEPVRQQPAPTTVPAERPSSTPAANPASTQSPAAAEPSQRSTDTERSRPDQRQVGRNEEPTSVAASDASASTADSAPSQPATSLPLDVSTSAEPAALDNSKGMSPLPWLAALFAAAAAAGLFWWMRKQRAERSIDPGRLAFAGATAEAEPAPVMPRAAVPQPQPLSRPAPVPAPAPTPVADPVPAAKPANDGLIRSTGLKPSLQIQFMPDRLTLTDQEAVLHFSIRVENVGAAPARDVLVEAIMVSASPVQDQQIADFFGKPNGAGQRVPAIMPMDGFTINTMTRLPIDQVQTFEAGGRTMFVPFLAFNVLYRAGSSEQQNSASFLIGRGKADDEKLAPFRTDLGPRIYRGLSTRPHSRGLGA